MRGSEGQVQILTFLKGGLVFDFYWIHEAKARQRAGHSEQKSNLGPVI